MLDKHPGPVAGIDEAGRGPWAGPVVAAAVILDMNALPDGLNDSKKLKPERRRALFEYLQQHADIGIGIADVARIDRDNILQATLWAMTQALGNLAVPPGCVLIDGNQTPGITCPSETLVKGDSRSLSIAAASICAKVVRDDIICGLARDFPGYRWESNKGYGTADHARGLQEFGVSPHHRRSFKPVRAILEEDPQHTL